MDTSTPAKIAQPITFSHWPHPFGPDHDAFAARLKAAVTASQDACGRSLPEAIGAENMLAQAQIALRCGHEGSARSLLLLTRDRIDAAIKILPV